MTLPAVLTEPTLLEALHVAERAQQAGGNPKPTSLFPGWTSALPKARGCSTEISLLQVPLNRTRVQGHPGPPTSHWTVSPAQMSFVSKRRDKIWSCILYTGLQWILRSSYSHQRCIFHPGTRSRHINPTAHNTFTVFKMCRWSMCRRMFYEQEMLEQPIVVRGQHRSCQQRL